MYKNKLQNFVNESFLNEKIDFERLLLLTEKIEHVNEEKAKEIYTEQVKPLTFLGLVLGGMFAGYVSGKIVQATIKNILKSKQLCKNQTSNIIDPKKRKIANYTCQKQSLLNVQRELRTNFNKLKSSCSSTKNPEKCVATNMKKFQKAEKIIEKMILEIEKKLRKTKQS